MEFPQKIDCGILEFWNFRILEFQNFGILEFWNIARLVLGGGVSIYIYIYICVVYIDIGIWAVASREKEISHVCRYGKGGAGSNRWQQRMADTACHVGLYPE